MDKKMEQIKLLTEYKDSAMQQLKTMEEAEVSVEENISRLEEKLEYIKSQNAGLVVGDVSVEVLLENQINYEKDNLMNFRVYKQPREKMYKDQVVKIEQLLEGLLAL
ncbi:hypothetical protein [Bacillus paranthracis]|uniref:hypothetical protein n=1 Tax=Bacillus cereus group TaxID=86661 RepID=UPI003D1C0C61